METDFILSLGENGYRGEEGYYRKRRTKPLLAFIGTSVRLLKRHSFAEVAGIFMDCLATLVIALHDLNSLNKKITHAKLLNPLIGLKEWS